MGWLPNSGEVIQPPMMAPAPNGDLCVAKSRKTATIALVDNVALSRDCLLISLLPRLGEEIVIESFASIEEMMSSEATRFDLMLLYMHNNTGRNLQAAIEAIGAIQMPVLVITDDKATDLRLFFGDVLRAGICGLVSTVDSGAELLSAAARFALSGGTFFPSELILRNSEPSMQSLPPKKAVAKKAPGGLTGRQAEVFTKLQQGKSNKVIAYELGISESTTKVHVRSIMRSIGATNRTQAVFMAQERPSSSVMPQIRL